ncbi:hypothetical protein [Pseudomonas cerasi]|uniref:hypothetical protein n=1 Tax=Pseudomonas cerasi TaxID=1583341 RepID=UPI0016557456|nr:hypothetical protein [Pseudomonas cerasi]MBC8877898.1 hypothetical protein [Pseudomonas cerasi]
MTDKAKNDAQPAIDAIVLGDSDLLARALQRLSTTLPDVFIRVTGQLIDATQREYVSVMCIGIGHVSDFYHADGKVFGAVYTNSNFLARKAGPSGVGIEYEKVKGIAVKARTEYDETVLKKALQLKDALNELDKMLGGHSFADSKLTSLAHVDLFKGHALLLAALNPATR